MRESRSAATASAASETQARRARGWAIRARTSALPGGSGGVSGGAAPLVAASSRRAPGAFARVGAGEPAQVVMTSLHTRILMMEQASTSCRLAVGEANVGRGTGRPAQGAVTTSFTRT